MIELQVLSKVLSTKSWSLIDSNNITDEYFISYPEEYKFIKEHKDKYGNIPDTETFLQKFQDFELLNVQESDDFLIHTFKEEYQYAKLVPVVNRVAELLQSDSNSAVEYLKSEISNFRIEDTAIGTNIITDASIRLQEWEDRKNNPGTYSLESGFEELDEYTGGYQMGEELVVFFARTGEGKTWVLLKSLQHNWKMGKRVGLIEPEMSSTKTGYRFDTLNSHVSNTALIRGRDVAGYSKYINALQKQEIPFIVAHPKDFNRKVTVSKLKTFIETHNLDLLAVDGISYLSDERGGRNDSRTISLTNISEDLMELSIETKIPILVVSQSNRGGVQSNTPDLENIRDSDGIAFNASQVISIKKKDDVLQMSIKKNRNGENGVDLMYSVNIDTGDFRYIANPDNDSDTDTQAAQQNREQFDDGKEHF